MGLLHSSPVTGGDKGVEVALLTEELACLKLLVERERQEKERERQEKERALCEMELQSLMSKTSTVKPGVFSIRVPEHFSISTPVLNALTGLVKDYNSDSSKSTERSGSINDKRSVHCLWRDLLERILRERDVSDNSRDSEDRTRVVYEWEINCPRTGHKNYIDFAFTDAACTHLSWLRYRGGIELKKNPPKLSSGENSGSGTANTIGRRQALSRAAMCVYAFLEAAGWKVPSGGFRSYSCYCDARTFAVARVSVDVDLKVLADVYGPISLPGIVDESADPALVPRILKHLLTSPTDALRDLLSAPPPTNPTIRGFKGGAEVEWELGQVLGVGGFALVCCGGSVSESEGVQPVSTVIKTATIPQHTYKLREELEILLLLQKKLANEESCVLTGVPRCVDFLESSQSTSQKRCCVALRLTPLGVTVPKFLRLFDPFSSAEVYTNLVRRMGPALVSILRAAHAGSICHGDIRPSNLLIVPSPSDVASIVQARGDFRMAPEAIKSINLDDSTFVLNDWGEAEKRRGDEDKAEDLQCLVAALTHLSNLPDVSSVSVTRGEPVRLEEGSGSRTDGPQAPSISREAVSKLKNLAAEKNYSELIQDLGSVQFSSHI